MAISKWLGFAFAAVGASAVVAGCGGGGGAGGPVPVAGGPVVQASPTSGTLPQFAGKATLTLMVPGRRPNAAAKRPAYVSPYTSRIDVQVVPAFFPSPWPKATSTTVPTPGPTPSGGATPTPIPVTMTVPAPIGNAQFAVNTYDSNGYLLSGVTSTPMPISANAAANNLTLTLQAAAQCVQINHAQGKSGAVDFYVSVLSDQTVAQSKTFVVTPCDADGNVIPAGQTLANSIILDHQYPGPIAKAHVRKPANVSYALSFSPSTITQGGDTTVTVTYAANSGHLAESAYVYPSLGPPAIWGTVMADPAYYVYAADSTSNAIAGFMTQYSSTALATLPAIPVGNTPMYIVGGSPMQGCAQGGEVVVVNNGDLSASILTIPTPTQVNPTPLPTVTQTIKGLQAPATSIAMDNSCNVTIGESGGNVDVLSHPFGSVTPLLSSQFGGANASAIAFLGGLTYIGAADGTSPNTMITMPGMGNTPFQTVDAMVPFNGSDIAVAYHSGGAFTTALYDGTSVLNTPSPIASAPPTIVSMATDNSQYVYAVSNSGFYEYYPWAPALNAVTVQSQTSPSPRAIAYAPAGAIYYITDAATNTIQSWNLSGNSAYYGSNYAAGKTPQGLAVFP